MATFYLSSTFEDLKECRELVSAELQKMGHRVVGMENYTAGGAAPLEKCLADVAGCDAYIGLFAWRYGYVPEDDNPARKSITELEYLEAVKLGLEPLIFILSDEARWPQNHVDRDKRQVEALRSHLLKSHTTCFFKDCEDLTIKVLTTAARFRHFVEEPVKPSEPTRTPQPNFKGVKPTASPYVGPTHFTRMDWGNFFGREHEAGALVELIMRSRIVLVFAASGAGKSSLLNTLVCKRLEETGHHVLLDARVGGTPPETVRPGETVDMNIFSFNAVYALQKRPPNLSVRLADYLRALPRAPGMTGRVLVFDQFEELFTQHGDRYQDRAGFVDDLVVALKDDPNLHLVFAMRQEHLAEFKQLAERFPADPGVKDFWLPRVGEFGALEAITRPPAQERFARFAPGVAEKILRKLYTVKVPGPDGTPRFKRAEFIEMMHLQIVCHRLWARLPRGITVIEEVHLMNAASGGQTFDDFFDNILDDFYDWTVKEVSNSDETRVHGGYSEELIRLGCMQFVTPALTRAVVKRTNERVGRLPYYIVKQLNERHLLRCEKRSDDEWYELAHDHLVKPIGRGNDRKFSALLYASEVLDKMLEQAVRGKDGRLKGYFKSHPDILKEWETFRAKAVLFEDEMDFLFRVSLASDYQTDEWSDKAQKDYPERWVEVLREALSNKRFKVSQNAAIIVGKQRVEKLSPELVRLALSDVKPDVRRAATVSLVRFDEPRLYEELIKKLNEPQTRDRALSALAYTRVAADSEPAPEFEKAFSRQLSRSERGCVKRMARILRFREEWPAILFIGFLAGVFGALSAIIKGLPGYFGFAVTQAQGSIGMGIFQGLTAGFIWAGAIVLGVTVHDRVFARKHDPRNYVRLLGAVVSGALGGVLGSVVIVFIIASVFADEPLRDMGWITSNGALFIGKLGEIFGKFRPLTESSTAIEAFTGKLGETAGKPHPTHFGYVHLITGLGLGAGMAWMATGLLKSSRWAAFVEEHQSKLFRLRQTKGTVFRIMRIARHHVLPLVAAIAVAAAVAFLVPHAPEGAKKYFGEEAKNIYCKNLDDKPRAACILATSIAGDCMTQAFGGFFGIVGMGLGIIIVRYGFEFRPRKQRF